jgi:hypothetical protein
MAVTKKPEPTVVKGGLPRSVRVESGEVFVLQKNIPISGTYRSLGPHLRYPFAEMSAGESFEIKVNKTELKVRVSRLSSACASYVRSRNTSAKFTVRRVKDDTIRVWRIK